MVECKSFLGVDDINDHLERLDKFKTYWPEYAAYELLGAVAAMVLSDSVGRQAYRQGLFVLAQNGEIVEIKACLCWRKTAKSWKSATMIVLSPRFGRTASMGS